MKTYTMIYADEIRDLTGDEVLAEIDRLEKLGFHVREWNNAMFGDCFLVCYW